MGAYNYRKLTRKLKKLGFRLFRHGKGSHELWVDGQGHFVPIPHHGGKDIRSGTLEAVAKQVGLKNAKGLDKIR